MRSLLSRICLLSLVNARRIKLRDLCINRFGGLEKKALPVGLQINHKKTKCMLRTKSKKKHSSWSCYWQPIIPQINIAVPRQATNNTILIEKSKSYTLLKPILTYGCEIWTMSAPQMKILRKIYYPIRFDIRHHLESNNWSSDVKHLFEEQNEK